MPPPAPAAEVTGPSWRDMDEPGNCVHDWQWSAMRALGMACKCSVCGAVHEPVVN